MILLYSTTIREGLYYIYIWRLLYWHVYILVKHVFIVVLWILSRLHYMCLKPLLYLRFTPLNIPVLSIVNTLLHHVIVSSYCEFYHDIIYIRLYLPLLLYYTIYIRSCLLPPFTLGFNLPPLLYPTLLYYLPYITLYYTTTLYTIIHYPTIHYITIHYSYYTLRTYSI